MSILDKTDISLGVLESLVNISSDIEILKNELNNPLQKELVVNIEDKLNIIINILDDIPQPIIVEESKKTSNFRSLIFKLGIHAEVLKLRELGKTVSEICTIMNVSKKTLRRFFKYYDHVSNVERIKLRTNSVMNTPERLEELFNMILKRLHMLEGHNDELHVQYIKEMRQTLALANQVSEKMTNYQEYQKFTQNVWELLKSELPEKRSLIVQKIAYLQQAHGNIESALTIN